uniref:Cytidine/uridine monophosphate kinase 1 n=1 Tax=Eptatretus burgeri TaxID=7764 RepID=A0A8C4WUD1_EPTBU
MVALCIGILLNMAKLPDVVFVLGAPGAGKGTQSKRIVEDFGYTHLSVGDLLRAERSRDGSEVGRLIDTCIREGQIVPIKITISDCMLFVLQRFITSVTDVDGGYVFTPVCLSSIFQKLRCTKPMACFDLFNSCLPFRLEQLDKTVESESKEN